MGEKSKNFNLLIIAIMAFFSFIVSIIIFLDNNKPEYYSTLFLLPFSFILFLVIFLKSYMYLFSRISVCITVLFYFARNVIVPFFMIFGNYSTFVPTNFLCYASEAVLLSVYETMVVSIFLFIRIKRLNVLEEVNGITENTSDLNNTLKGKLPFRLKFLVISLFLYIIIVLSKDPTIIRQVFMLLIGTPDDWYVRADYRQLGSNGTGILGIFVTFVITVFWLIQAIVPPIILLWVIKNKKSIKSQIFAVYFIAAVVLMIVTGTRAHSLECAVAIILVGLSIYGEQMKRKLPIIVIIGLIATIYNLLQKSGISTFNPDELSKMVSSYFGGIQNVAAGIYVNKNVSGMNVSFLPADILLKIPYFSSFFEGFFNVSSGSIFNNIIGQGKSTGQIIPAISQGYIYFGFLLAPIIPCLGVHLSIEFERKARKVGNIIYKNIYYIAAIMFARIAPSTNLMSGVQYLFYTILTLCVVKWSYLYVKQNKAIEYKRI